MRKQCYNKCNGKPIFICCGKYVSRIFYNFFLDKMEIRKVCKKMPLWQSWGKTENIQMI